MPNEHFTIYPNSVSSTVSSYQKIAEDDYTALRLDFKNSYVDGEIVEFSFKINQNKMLCQKEGRYFYEFVPGWFNSIPVEAYEFKWKQSEHCLQTNAHRSIDGYHVWQGTLDCGGYEKMQVHYDNTIFENCETVTYTHFNDSDAYNDLIAVKRAGMAVAFIIAGVLFVPMVYIIDCYVSYNRGRGFLSGYGYRIHTYGRKNTHYIRARSAHTSTYHGGGGGRGCACACACACAGGGRAGCSQKDTYTNIPFQKKNP